MLQQIDQERKQQQQNVTCGPMAVHTAIHTTPASNAAPGHQATSLRPTGGHVSSGIIQAAQAASALPLISDITVQAVVQQPTTRPASGCVGSAISSLLTLGNARSETVVSTHASARAQHGVHQVAPPPAALTDPGACIAAMTTCMVAAGEAASPAHVPAVSGRHQEPTGTALRTSIREAIAADPDLDAILKRLAAKFGMSDAPSLTAVLGDMGQAKPSQATPAVQSPGAMAAGSSTSAPTGSRYSTSRDSELEQKDAPQSPGCESRSTATSSQPAGPSTTGRWSQQQTGDLLATTGAQQCQTVKSGSQHLLPEVHQDACCQHPDHHQHTRHGNNPGAQELTGTSSPLTANSLDLAHPRPDACVQGACGPTSPVLAYR
jgi:hypothetical protein